MENETIIPGSCNGNNNGDTANPTSDAGGSSGGGIKRRRKNDDDNNNNAYQQAYDRVRFHPIASTGRPGTPHCYFTESYTVEFTHDSDKEEGDDIKEEEVQPQEATRKMKKHDYHHQRQQVVHKHANGLVIVTAGSGPDWFSSSNVPSVEAKEDNDIDDDDKNDDEDMDKQNKKNDKNSNDIIIPVVESIDFKVQEAAVAAQNAACKRKHQSKMLKGKNSQVQQRQELGIVQPHDVLAVVTLFQHNNNNNNNSICTSIPLSCCVWGTILERNHVNLEKNPALLQHDPLLDGYLAVILPTGPFPPPSSS